MSLIAIVFGILNLVVAATSVIVEVINKKDKEQSPNIKIKIVKKDNLANCRQCRIDNRIANTIINQSNHVTNNYNLKETTNKSTSPNNLNKDDRWLWVMLIFIVFGTGIFLYNKYLLVVQIFQCILFSIVLGLYVRDSFKALPFMKKFEKLRVVLIPVFFFQPLIMYFLDWLMKNKNNYSLAINLYRPDLNFSDTMEVTFSNLLTVTYYGMHCVTTILVYFFSIITLICIIYRCLFDTPPKLIKKMDSLYKLRYFPLVIYLFYSLLIVFS
ncbi:MAG: hypothetical protein E7476_06700 [Ruminococcaceae bacterium]|nr:hypothetical protein [Oscillospiraceae bacterium]